MAGAPDVQVRVLAPRASAWALEIEVKGHEDEAIVVEDLLAARGALDAHLRVPLPFWVKLKFQMILVEMYRQDPFDDDAPEVDMDTQYYWLQPAPWKVSPNANPERRMAQIVSVARVRLETHLEAARFRGSRQFIGGISKIYVLVAPAGEMSRLPGPAIAEDRQVGAPKQYVLPEGLSGKHGIWNPQNKDHQCFSWCVRAHMAGVADWSSHDRKNSAERLRDPRFFQASYAPKRTSGRPHRGEELVLEDFGMDFSALPKDRGTTFSDIQLFEEANRGKIGCYVFEWVQVDWGERRFYESQQIRAPSVENAENLVLLLRVQQHYMLIHNFNAFCSRRAAELDGSRRLSHTPQHTCARCGVNFSTEARLTKHQETPCHRDVTQRKTVLRMPDPAKQEDLLRYKCRSSAELTPLTLYADLETWSEQAPDPLVGEHTSCLQHTVASAAFLAVCHNGYQVSEEDRCYLTVAEAGDHKFAVVERFLRKALMVAQDYVEWKKTTNVMPIPSTEQWERHQQATHCQRCNVSFIENHSKRMKVCHHRHGTGQYIEAVCASCNKGIRQPFCVPLVMHNGGNYDFKFLLRAISALRGGNTETTAVPDGDELIHEAQDVGEAVDFAKLKFTVLFKSGEKMLQFQLGNLLFTDSVNFYKQSLGDLMDELKKSAQNGDLASIFPNIAAVHPDLQEERLTEERRKRLWLHFAPPGSPEEGWRVCPLADFKRWTWELLLRKLPMPFEHMAGPEVWLREPVWPRECYNSKLDPPTDDAQEKKNKAYQLLVETAWIMNWKSFREVHDAYLLMDLALSDVLETFRGVFFSRFKLDALQYVTLPSAAFDAMLFFCTRESAIRLIVDEDVYTAVRNSIMGGLSNIFQPWACANHPGLPNFNPLRLRKEGRASWRGRRATSMAERAA